MIRKGLTLDLVFNEFGKKGAPETRINLRSYIAAFIGSLHCISEPTHFQSFKNRSRPRLPEATPSAALMYQYLKCFKLIYKNEN